MDATLGGSTSWLLSIPNNLRAYNVDLKQHKLVGRANTIHLFTLGNYVLHNWEEIHSISLYSLFVHMQQRGLARSAGQQVGRRSQSGQGAVTFFR